MVQHFARLEITTNRVANVTNISFLGTKNSGSITTLATRFLYDLDLNQKIKVKTYTSSCLVFLSS